MQDFEFYHAHAVSFITRTQYWACRPLDHASGDRDRRGWTEPLFLPRVPRIGPGL